MSEKIDSATPTAAEKPPPPIILRKFSLWRFAVYIAGIMAILFTTTTLFRGLLPIVIAMAMVAAVLAYVKLVILRDQRLALRHIKRREPDLAQPYAERSEAFFRTRPKLDQAIRFVTFSGISNHEIALANLAFLAFERGDKHATRRAYEALKAAYPNSAFAHDALRLLELGEKQ